MLLGLIEFNIVPGEKLLNMWVGLSKDYTNKHISDIPKITFPEEIWDVVDGHYSEIMQIRINDLFEETDGIGCVVVHRENCTHTAVQMDILDWHSTVLYELHLRETRFPKIKVAHFSGVLTGRGHYFNLVTDEVPATTDR